MATNAVIGQPMAGGSSVSGRGEWVVQTNNLLKVRCWGVIKTILFIIENRVYICVGCIYPDSDQPQKRLIHHNASRLPDYVILNQLFNLTRQSD